MTTRKLDENRIAELIVSVFPAGVARACSADRDTIRYAVREAGLKLKEIVLNRASLKKLISDPQREVKIEYLQRDLVASAARRSEFRYPRLSRLTPSRAIFRRVPFGLPMVSVV